MRELADLRQELAEIDRNIMELVGRRNATARLIGERKAATREGRVP